MEQIQDLIKRHIDANGYTIYSLASICGINRTTLQKVLAGQRKLTTQMYEKLIPFFSLSPSEKAEFDKYFLIDQIGQDRYQTHMQIRNILETPADLLGQSSAIQADSFITDVSEIPDYAFIHDQFQITSFIYSIVRYAVKNFGDPYLYIFADMSKSYISNLLKLFYNEEFSSLTTTQLIEFCKVRDLHGNYDNMHNLQCIANLLPFFSACTGNFSVRYYYAAHNDFQMEVIAFPNYIITNTHVIFLSPDFREAFFVANEEFRQHYLDVYNSALSRSHTLTNGKQSPSELLDQIMDSSPATYPEHNMCINVQPTFEKFFTPSMIDKYMYDTPYRDILKTKLLARIKQLESENHTVLFTYEGLELFSRYGKVMSFPDNLAARTDVADRITILNRIIESNSNPDDYTFLLIDRNKLRTSLNLTISFAPPMTTYIMLTRNDGNTICIPLCEHSICSSIMDFVQMLPQYDMILSVEDTNRILQNHIDELSRQL